MELKVKTPTIPDVIEFNFDELKGEITEKVAAYVDLVYTEDEIKDAKKDIAMLRKFTKALSDERIRVKKEMLTPYEKFEGRINELSGIVEKAIVKIDLQIKDYEDRKRQEKLKTITEYFASIEKPFEIPLEKIMNKKWLNASVSLKNIYSELDATLENIKKDLATLSNLPEFAFEAVETYKSTLDLNFALNEGKRLSEMQRRKEEQGRLKAEAELPGKTEFKDTELFEQIDAEAKKEQREWIGFRAFLTAEDALALRSFFEYRNIMFEAI